MTRMKHASVRLATARAVSVLPVPGGPYSITPFGGSTRVGRRTEVPHNHELKHKSEKKVKLGKTLTDAEFDESVAVEERQFDDLEQ